MQNLVSIVAVRASPQIGEMLPPCVTVLSCRYLFFSIPAPRGGRTAGPIFTLYGSNDVFPRKDGPFGVRTMGGHIRGGELYAQNRPKMGMNKQFQAKTAKYKNRNISKTK